MKTILTGLAILFLISAPKAQEMDYGSTDFPTSGTPEAQKVFLRGLLMLHSFEYEDAREAFQQAREIDPDFAMAYWGEAMTHNHPVWFRQNLAEGRAALDKLAPTPAARLSKAPTQREKDYLQTLEILYGEGDKKERDYKYEEAVAKLAKKYPEDLDAASFHALAILGTSHDGRDFTKYMRAAAIVEEVFAKNPRHPGAAHYLIHSYDDPVHAPLGLRPARVYARIAPSASHALHMPSHIFVALGMWDEASQSNVDSYTAAKNRSNRKDVLMSGHGYHALTWLVYSALQQGRFEYAGEQLALLNTHFDKNKTSGSGRSHRLSAWTAYLINTGEWTGEFLNSPFDASSMPSDNLATYYFVKGLAAVNSKNQEAAEQALSKLADVRAPEDQATTAKGIEVMQLELRALLSGMAGDHAKCLDLMTQAVAVEDEMPLDFGPPWPPKPAHELFGEVLLEHKRFDEAREQFELALAKAPRRTLTMLGLARAAFAMKNLDTSQEIYRELGGILKEADDNLSFLDEVKQRTGKPATGTN